MTDHEAPALSVVIPALDAEDTIAGQLEALARQAWAQPWEVVVADNGSSDGTVAVVRTYESRLPRLRVVDASQKRGAAYALNVGVQAAAGKAVVFCDADDEVGEGWVAAVGDALGEHEFVASRQDHEKLNEPWLAESRDRVLTESLPQLWFPPHLPHGGSGGLGIRKELHERIGGFDESLPVLYDTDYCIRAQLQGATLSLVRDAVVHYRFRQGFLPIFRQARAYAVQGTLLQKRYADRDAVLPRHRFWLLRGWKPILAVLPRVHRPQGRARLGWLLGWQAGRYLGGLKHRVRAVF